MFHSSVSRACFVIIRVSTSTLGCLAAFKDPCINRHCCSESRHRGQLRCLRRGNEKAKGSQAKSKLHCFGWFKMALVQNQALSKCLLEQSWSETRVSAFTRSAGVPSWSCELFRSYSTASYWSLDQDCGTSDPRVGTVIWWSLLHRDCLEMLATLGNHVRLLLLGCTRRHRPLTRGQPLCESFAFVTQPN